MANKEMYHVDLATGKTSVKHKKVSKGSKHTKGGKKKSTKVSRPGGRPGGKGKP
tara:strand:+ start:483 stop:644 length:162 start_codon:yes stop_codon:yes gene_type:complete